MTVAAVLVNYLLVASQALVLRTELTVRARGEVQLTAADKATRREDCSRGHSSTIACRASMVVPTAQPDSSAVVSDAVGCPPEPLRTSTPCDTRPINIGCLPAYKTVSQQKPHTDTVSVSSISTVPYSNIRVDTPGAAGPIVAARVHACVGCCVEGYRSRVSVSPRR